MCEYILLLLNWNDHPVWNNPCFEYFLFKWKNEGFKKKHLIYTIYCTSIATYKIKYAATSTNHIKYKITATYNMKLWNLRLIAILYKLHCHISHKLYCYCQISYPPLSYVIQSVLTLLISHKLYNNCPISYKVCCPISLGSLISIWELIFILVFILQPDIHLY